MGSFQRLLDATADDYAASITRNPLLQMLRVGQVQRGHYAAYLVQLFHFVRHTSRALGLAAARLEDPARELRGWLLAQAHDEHGHELLCLRDLEQLGVDASAAVLVGPGPGVWGLVTQNYFMASVGNPAGLLGVASATEGMGAELAENMAALLVERYDIPRGAVSFLRSHAGFDQRHYAEVRAAVDAAPAADFDAIVLARRMTFRYYGQMLLDVAGAVETLNVGGARQAA